MEQKQRALAVACSRVEKARTSLAEQQHGRDWQPQPEPSFTQHSEQTPGASQGTRQQNCHRIGSSLPQEPTFNTSTLLMCFRSSLQFPAVLGWVRAELLLLRCSRARLCLCSVMALSAGHGRAVQTMAAAGSDSTGWSSQ